VEAMDWIKIEDAQPEIHEYRPGSGTGSSDAVLVFLDAETENGSQFDVWRMYRGGRGDTTSIYWDWDYPKVTHWMPTPLPPKEIQIEQSKHLVIEIGVSAKQLSSQFIDGLAQRPKLVCIGHQTTTGEIGLDVVAAELVDVEKVGDGLGAKFYAHLQVLKTPMGSLLNALDPLSLIVNFSNFTFKDGELVPGYIEIFPK
jgi:hypothetical protein